MAIIRRANPVWFIVRLSLVAAMVVGLAACGRRGPPEAPPGAVITDENGKPVEGATPPFILDPLLQ